MQRAGLISPSTLFPNWRFFIPGSESSPITVPHLPSSLTLTSALEWLGGLTVGLAPFVGLYLVARATAMLRAVFATRIYRELPHPGNRRRVRSAPASADPLDPQSRRDPGFGSPDTAVPRAEENFRAAMAAAAAFSHPGGSGGGGDFGSDDEETEVVSATLISFDVEATEASDTPPGWCAELRPNVVESSGAAAPVSQEPLYRETALTMLPAALAARTLAFLPTYLVMEHFESAAWCGLVRSLLGRWGVPLDSIRQVGVFSGRGFTNLLGLNLFYFFAQAEGWAVVSMAAKGYTLEHEGDDEEPKTGSAPSPA